MSSWDEPARARTVAEANAQQYAFPPETRWNEFAHLIDGNAILAELDLNPWDYWPTQVDLYEANGNWDHLDILGLRLTLFMTERSLRNFLDWDPRPDEIARSLMHALGERLGKPYIPPKRSSP